MSTADMVLMAGAIAAVAGVAGAITCFIGIWNNDALFAPLLVLSCIIAGAGAIALLVGAGMWIAIPHTLHVGGAR